MRKEMQTLRKEPFLHKIVFELKYLRGYLYLDRCGRTIDDLFATYPEWVVRDDGISPQNAPLISLRNSAVLNFSSKKIDLSLEMKKGETGLQKEEVTAFIEQADQTTNLIIQQLGLKEFERIGFRAWYIFPCESNKEAYSLLSNLQLFQISPEALALFGSDIDSIGLTVIFTGTPNCRLSLQQVEQTAAVEVGQEILSVRASKLPKDQNKIFHEQLRVKKRLLANPSFAVMIDLDVFEDNPVRPEPGGFIQKGMEYVKSKIVSLQK